MSSADQKILDRFNSLIAEAQSIVAQCGWDGHEFQRWPDMQDYYRIRSQAINLIKRVCGEDSEHFISAQRFSDDKSRPDYVIHWLGLLEAARSDYQDGFLFDLKSLVTADVLSDFIEQAEMLLEHGFYHPAASLIGAVLEDTLRKLCDKHAIPYPPKTKMDALNAELARKGIYDKLIQKRITHLADIRNNADHGHFQKFKKEDVEDMLSWVRRFTVDYLH